MKALEERRRMIEEELTKPQYRVSASSPNQILRCRRGPPPTQVAAWDARRTSLLRPLEFPKRSAGPDFKNQPERARCCLIFTSRKRRSMRRAGELDWCASIYVLVHLAAQLVFSSEMIASHRLTNSDHCSAKSAFTSPVLAISALSRLAVAR